MNIQNLRMYHFFSLIKYQLDKGERIDVRLHLIFENIWFSFHEKKVQKRWKYKNL